MGHRSKPSWLKVNVLAGKEIRNVETVLDKYRLNSVCREAKCPNRIECYNKQTATFLILGRECTRGCRFCNVSRNTPEPPLHDEPSNIAVAVKELKLKYVVITSVTRDDLIDGGSKHFCSVVDEIRSLNIGVKIELLIPDFKGDSDSLNRIIAKGPDVINHNIETVERLYNKVRIGADYKRSLSLLRRIKQRSDIPVKSGIILGLGESDSEIHALLEDLKDAGCDYLTIGQYLSPSKEHLRVEKYITPKEFDRWKSVGLKLGFKGIQSGPMVRSSYNADLLVSDIKE